MENEAVLINKYESIEKCINRINEEYDNNPENLEDYRKMDAMCNNMKGMVGFRNIAIHEYKQLDEEIVRDVIENHLGDIKEFVRAIINLER